MNDLTKFQIKQIQKKFQKFLKDKTYGKKVRDLFAEYLEEKENE